MGTLREDFAALLADGDRADLARAALAIARIGHPALDPEPALRELDALAAGARARLRPGMRPEEVAAEVAAHLFGECGFHGNSENYYDPRNSFLNEVLAARRGLPITLSVVFMEVSARVGLRVDGVGFPGHFLVRVAGSAGPVVLDPYSGGRVVSDEELLVRFRALPGTDADADRVPAAAVETAGTRAILARMLRNLLHVYLERDEAAHALDTVQLLLVLTPDAPDAIRLRGLLFERLECFGAALDDLRRYLALVPDAADATEVRERVTRLTRAAATIN